MKDEAAVTRHFSICPSVSVEHEKCSDIFENSTGACSLASCGSEKFIEGWIDVAFPMQSLVRLSRIAERKLFKIGIVTKLSDSSELESRRAQLRDFSSLVVCSVGCKEKGPLVPGGISVADPLGLQLHNDQALRDRSKDEDRVATQGSEG